MNFTDVATRPYIQIQKSAPGPPEMMAVATPAMLPVPIEAPSAVMNAWNGVSAPPARGRLLRDHRAERLGQAPELHEA